MNITTPWLLALALLPSYGASASPSCEGAKLELTKDDVVFSENCGEGASWEYRTEPEGSSFIAFRFEQGVITRKKIEAYPGQDKVQCTITVKARYPKGCTFSPSYAGFRGTGNISRDHSGLASITLAEASDPDATLTLSSPPLRGNLGAYAIGLDLVASPTALWAPCTGETTFTLSLALSLTDLDSENPGQNLSFIRQRAGAIEFAHDSGLGFKKCVPPPR